MINMPDFRNWFPCHAADLQQAGVPLRFESRVLLFREIYRLVGGPPGAHFSSGEPEDRRRRTDPDGAFASLAQVLFKSWVRLTRRLAGVQVIADVR